MKTLFFSPYLWWKLHALYDFSFYHGLRIRGHEVDLISCDGFLPECDLYWSASNNSKDSDTCTKCANFSKNLLNWAQIPENWLGSYLTPDDTDGYVEFINSTQDKDLLSLNWQGYPISDWVISSVHSHFRCNKINLRDKQHVIILRRYLLGAMKTIHAIKNYFNFKKPDLIIMFNGRMAPTRVMLELAKEAGIKVFCHERGSQKEYIQFYEDSSCINIEKYKLITDNWSDIPLKKFEIEKVFQWFRNRRDGVNFNFKPFNISQNLDFLTNDIELAKKNNQLIWTLFTSSVDEIAAHSDIFYSDFKSQEDWIMATVDYVRHHQNILLIIKSHPNIESMGKNQEEFDFVQQLRMSIPDNVRVIGPTEKVSTYALIEVSNLGLCSATTVAIELAARGVPVLTSMNSHFNFLESIKYIYDSGTYHQILDDYHAEGDNLNERNRIQIMAFRYIYSNYYRVQLHFPLVTMTDSHTGELNAKSINDFSPGTFDCLDQAIEIFLGNMPLAPISNRQFDQSSVDEEEQLVKEASVRILNLSKPEIFFSVIVTCYNYEQYLLRCLHSIANQTIDNFEIIIVDDGSTDNSLDVALKFKSSNPDLKISIISVSNSGQPAISRNNGIKLAKGKYILPLDADDKINSSYLEDAYCELLDSASDIDLLYFDVLFEYPHLIKRELPGSFDLEKLSKTNQLCYCSIYKKELWTKVNGYRENVRGYEDWDFWLACSLLSPNSKYVNKVGLIYNAKVGGLYTDALQRHNNLYAQIVINNQAAFNNSEISQATLLLSSRACKSLETRMNTGFS